MSGRIDACIHGTFRDRIETVSMNPLQGFDSNERSILAVTCYGHFMSHVNMLVFPSLVLPLAQTMNMEVADVLGISFWMYLLFGVSALPWGLAADRLGSRPFLLLLFLGAGMSGLAAGVWFGTPAGLAASLASLGLFSGIYHPVGLGLISKGIGRVSVALGYNGMSGNAGLFAAPLLAGLMTMLWGPRAAFFFVGLANLFGLLLMLLYPIAVSNSEKDSTGDTQQVMRSAFFILLVAMMMGGLVYRGSTVILPTYFEIKNQGIFHWVSSWTGLEMSENLIATVSVSLVYLAGMAGQYTGGRAAERYDPRICYLIFYSITIPAAFVMAVTIDLPLVVLSTVFFFFLLGMQPVENTLVSRFTPERFRHSAFGTKFVLNFGVGSLAVKIVEELEASAGMETIFSGMGFLLLLLMGVIVVLLATTSRRA